MYNKEDLFANFINVKSFKLSGKFCSLINNQDCFFTFPPPDFLHIGHIPFNLNKLHNHF